MHKRMIVEPLRERLYMITESVLSCIDSRVIFFYEEDIPANLDATPEFIYTHKYFLIQSGDMVPCDELYKDQIPVFTKSRFDRNKQYRDMTYECVFYGLMEDYYGKPVNKDELVTKAIDEMEELGLSIHSLFEEELSEYFESRLNKVGK